MPANNTNLTFHQEVTSFSASYDLREYEDDDEYYEYEREVSPIRRTSYQKHYHPEENSGICVVRRKGESVDDLIKRFRKKFSKSGLAKELRDKMYYEKPSDKRRRKKMQSIRLIQREQKKMEDMQEKYEKFKQKKVRMRAKQKRKERQDDQGGSRQNRSRNYEGKQNKRRTDLTD